jgi:hypothetical protein
MAKSIDGAHESVLLTTVDGPSVTGLTFSNVETCGEP